MKRAFSLASLAPLAVAASLFMACGEPSRPAAGPAQASAPASPAERLFPLEEGKIYHYVTKDGDDAGMLVAKVHRVDAAHGELRLSNATRRFTVLPDGVSYDGGAYILKAPFEVGTSWPGEHGGTTKIVSTDAAVTVPAGSYAGCVRTVEDATRRPPGARFETTYCPGVGMVLLVASAPGSEGRAELKSYGMPVKIE